MRELYTIRFTALRMMRDYITMLLLFIVPVVLITFFLFILGDSEQQAGVPAMDEMTITMVLVFQLFGGAIVMSLIHVDFFSERRYRIQSLPINTSLYGFMIMLAGTLYSIILGLLLMVYTIVIWDVNWGNIAWSLLVIGLMAILSSVICLVFTFSVKNFKIAERLSEVYGIGAVILAGLFFPMPDVAVIHWINDYVNPLTLAATAIDHFKAANFLEAWTNAGILAGFIIVFFVIMLATGRRRMP